MIRIGMIGTNFISDRLAEAARELPDIMLSAVYSRKKETGDTFAKRHGIASVYTDLECFLSSDIDAVYIASPNICHEKQAILAMQHKKHVLCEKPIASSQDALLSMMREFSKELRAFTLSSSRVSSSAFDIAAIL